MTIKINHKGEMVYLILIIKTIKTKDLFFYLNLLYILIYYKNLLIQSVTRIVSKDHIVSI